MTICPCPTKHDNSLSSQPAQTAYLNLLELTDVQIYTRADMYPNEFAKDLQCLIESANCSQQEQPQLKQVAEVFQKLSHNPGRQITILAKLPIQDAAVLFSQLGKEEQKVILKHPELSDHPALLLELMNAIVPGLDKTSVHIQNLLANTTSLLSPFTPKGVLDHAKSLGGSLNAKRQFCIELDSTAINGSNPCDTQGVVEGRCLYSSLNKASACFQDVMEPGTIYSYSLSSNATLAVTGVVAGQTKTTSEHFDQLGSAAYNHFLANNYPPQLVELADAATKRTPLNQSSFAQPGVTYSDHIQGSVKNPNARVFSTFDPKGTFVFNDAKATLEFDCTLNYRSAQLTDHVCTYTLQREGAEKLAVGTTHTQTGYALHGLPSSILSQYAELFTAMGKNTTLDSESPDDVGTLKLDFLEKAATQDSFSATGTQYNWGKEFQGLFNNVALASIGLFVGMQSCNYTLSKVTDEKKTFGQKVSSVIVGSLGLLAGATAAYIGSLNLKDQYKRAYS